VDAAWLEWLPHARLGAVGVLHLGPAPLDSAANDAIAVVFQQFLGSYRAQGAERPYLIIEAAQPGFVERRFAMLVPEFKWINFYGGTMVVLDPSSAVREALGDSAVADYIPLVVGLEAALEQLERSGMPPD